jgi:hypothetical protein
MAEAKPEKSSSKTSSPQTQKGRSMDIKTAGKFMFLAGLVLAIIIGVVPAASISEWVTWLLILLALVGGWLFIPEGEESEFILITLALVIFSEFLGALPPSLATAISGVFRQVANFLGIAVLAVAVRTIIGWFTPA